MLGSSCPLCGGEHLIAKVHFRPRLCENVKRNFSLRRF